jgi:hypothetical protein
LRSTAKWLAGRATIGYPAGGPGSAQAQNLGHFTANPYARNLTKLHEPAAKWTALQAAPREPAARLDSGSGVFLWLDDPPGAGKALRLLSLFDPDFQSVRRDSGLSEAIAQLDRALSNLAEEADDVADTLESFAHACGARTDSVTRRLLEAFLGLVGRGARGLAEAGRQPDQAELRATLAGYRELVAAAAFAPSLIAMKEYLRWTRLDPLTVDFRNFPEIGNLAAERRLLEAELGPQAPYSKVRDLLQTRFEKFKWSYVEQYRDAHERWRAEMEKASGLASDVERALDALLRLDKIGALGPPAGAQFVATAKRAREQIKVCGLQGPFSAHAVPICPECGYALGTSAPQLAQLLERIRRVLNEKLTTLSRLAIARLIKKYDHAHRLEGFLKITQVAQTEALARVLDDRSTAYITRLLRHLERDEPAIRPKR